MKTIIALVLFLVIGLAGSRGWVSRVRVGTPLTAFFLTGVEFFLIGVILGPSFLDVLSEQTLENLKPVVYLGLGWIGLLFGIQMSWLQLKRVKRAVYEMLAVDGTTFAVLFSAMSYLVLAVLFRNAPRSALLQGSAIMGITASVSSPTIIAVLSRLLPARSAYVSTLKLVSSLSAFVPIVLFGLFFILSHPGLQSGVGIGGEILWWFFANALGLVLGFVMVLLTVQRCTEDERILLIMGILMLASGTCYFLKLSSLYTAMMMGIVVGNFSRRKDHIYRQLVEFEKTIYIVFLILVGALTSMRAYFPLVLLFFYVSARIILKASLGAGLFRRFFPELGLNGPWPGMALIGQGGIVLAMVLDYRLAFGGEMVVAVTSAVIAAVICNEVIGIYLTRTALVRAGEAAGSRLRSGEEGG